MRGVRARAGGPALTVPPGTARERLADEHRSGWQLAQRVWEDSGVDWENVPVPPADPDPYAPGAFTAPQYEPLQYEPRQSPAGVNPTQPDLLAIPGPVGEDFGPGPWPVQPAPVTRQPEPDGEPAVPGPARPRRRPPATWSQYPPADFSGLPWPGDQDQPTLPPRAFAAPLGAPVMADAPPLAEPGELFREWQGSVREATRRTPWTTSPPDGPAAPRGRIRAAARIGVPAAVIVMVGAGALLLLTGRANEMLASTGAVSPATPGSSASVSPVSASLVGYPGAQGTVGVAAMWSAGSLTVAVGAADGHPAIWGRAADGSWSLVSSAVFGRLPGHLTAVTRGPLGWIAVGSVSEHGTVEPMLYQSADGKIWTPLPALTALAGDGAQFLGVTAGLGGYLVVGRQGSDQQTSAALWWSADLKSWSNGGSSGNTGSFTTAAISVGNGFVAVGSENDCHTIWTSVNGRQWTAHDLVKPAGAHTATLRSVAASPAGHIVAGGYATNSVGDIPIVVVSTDGGAHTTQIVLRVPAGPAIVTAVTADGDGFVAAGLVGPANAQHAVIWTSPDGLTWSAATPLAAAGSSEVTALADTTTTGAAPSITGTAQSGAAASLLTVPAP